MGLETGQLTTSTVELSIEVKHPIEPKLSALLLNLLANALSLSLLIKMRGFDVDDKGFVSISCAIVRVLYTRMCSVKVARLNELYYLLA